MATNQEFPKDLTPKLKSPLEAEARPSRKRFWLLLASVFGIAVLGMFAYGLTSSSLNGMIVDNVTGEPLIANVRTNGKSIQSNKQGEFALKGRPGQVRLTFSRKGYKSQKATFDIPFLIGKNVGKIRLKNGVITGEIKEATVAPQTVSKATISIGSKSVKVNSGRYVIKGVPVGKRLLKVDSPAHEKFEEHISVKGGENEVLIILSLTPKETARRYVQAWQSKDYGEMYDYAHPDSKAAYAREDYIADKMKEDEEEAFEISSFTLGDTTVSHEQTFNETGKTYKDVAEIKLTITYKIPALVVPGGSSEHTMHEKAYLVKMGRLWENLIIDATQNH